MVFYPFKQVFENLEHMELTSAIWIDPVTLMQPWAEEENRLKVTVRPFQLPVLFDFITYVMKYIIYTCFFKERIVVSYNQSITTNLID